MEIRPLHLQQQEEYEGKQYYQINSVVSKHAQKKSEKQDPHEEAAVGGAVLSLTLTHLSIHGLQMAGNNVQLLSKVYFLWLYGGGGCKHTSTHTHAHQHNTCVTYTVFIWSFSTFSELYVVCIAYSMRCTKPSILFAIENALSLSLPLSLYSTCVHGFRANHFVQNSTMPFCLCIYAHSTHYNHFIYQHIHIVTYARVRHFLFGTKRIFSRSISLSFWLWRIFDQLRNRHVHNGKLKRTKMFIHSFSLSLSASLCLFLSFCLSISIYLFHCLKLQKFSLVWHSRFYVMRKGSTFKMEIHKKGYRRK